MKKYAVVDRPGTVGGNQAKVWSAHKSLSLAEKARGKHTKNFVICFSEHGFKKGEVIWGDQFPHIAG